MPTVSSQDESCHPWAPGCKGNASTHRQDWQRALRFLSVVLILLSCSSCQLGADYEAQDGGGIHLKFWSATNPNEVEFSRLVARDWNRQHPDIMVEVEPIPAGVSSEEVLLASIAGGTTPDLCSNIWPGALEQYIEADGLVRLDDFPDFFEVMRRRMPEAVVRRFRSEDGHYYQSPWKTNPIMMQYNMRLFRQAGVDHPPRTYSELLAVGPKLTRDTDGDGETDQWMLLIDLQPIWYKRMFDFYPFYLAATGGRTLVRGDQILFDNQAAVEVFRLFQELFARGYVIKSLPYGDVFLQDLVAIQPNVGPWNIAHIERNRPGEMAYDFAPIPRPDNSSDPVITYGDYKNVAIFTTCRHPQAAWRFTKFMLSKQNDLRLLNVTNQLPIRGHLLDDPFFADFFQRNPKLVPFAEQALNTRGTDTAPELKEIFDALAQEFEACAVLGLKSPEQAVADAARRGRLILSLR